MNFTILILYQTQPSWLAQSRINRQKIFTDQVQPIFEEFTSQLSIGLFDAEAYHARSSDFMIVNCKELQPFYFFMEKLRDTELFSKPYIQLNDIIIGHGNGFRIFESQFSKANA